MRSKCFVDDIDGFVRQEPVADVAIKLHFRQLNRESK